MKIAKAKIIYFFRSWSWTKTELCYRDSKNSDPMQSSPGKILISPNFEYLFIVFRCILNLNFNFLYIRSLTNMNHFLEWGEENICKSTQLKIFHHQIFITATGCPRKNDPVADCSSRRLDHFYWDTLAIMNNRLKSSCIWWWTFIII